jgi:hypothetical protein
MNLKRDIFVILKDTWHHLSPIKLEKNHKQTQHKEQVRHVLSYKIFPQKNCRSCQFDSKQLLLEKNVKLINKK